MSDADFCAAYGVSCGPLTAADNCNRERTVPSCGTCKGARSACGGGGIAGVCLEPINDPYVEAGRYAIGDLTMAGEGAAIFATPGELINATVRFNHSCAGCDVGSVNQIIIGLGGVSRAQACIYSGPRSSNGVLTAVFRLRAPGQPGVYAVRNRYAQAFSCADGALDWWLVDRPSGPSAASNIGAIIVVP